MIQSRLTKQEVWDEIEALKKQEQHLINKRQAMDAEIGSIRLSLANLLGTGWKYPFEIV